MCDKDIKKEEKFKSKEERKQEINKIIRLLFANKYTIQIDGMPQFMEIAKEFIDNGTPWNGEIEMVGTKHKLVGFLINKKGKQCELMLKYDKNL